MRRQPNDVVLESYIDFGFKEESACLYAVGYLQKRQMLDPDSHRAFEMNAPMLQAFNEIFILKNLKEC